jgi:hypothetical protein
MDRVALAGGTANPLRHQYGMVGFKTQYKKNTTDDGKIF